MKIQPVELFYTPSSWAEVMDWIERHPPSDRPHLLTAAIMTWNLAASLANSEEEG